MNIKCSICGESFEPIGEETVCSFCMHLPKKTADKATPLTDIEWIKLMRVMDGYEVTARCAAALFAFKTHTCILEQKLNEVVAENGRLKEDIYRHEKWGNEQVKQLTLERESLKEQLEKLKPKEIPYDPNNHVCSCGCVIQNGERTVWCGDHY